MKKMKITLLLCLLCVLQLNAAQLLSAQAKVTLDMQNVPLENLFIELKKQTGSVFVLGILKLININLCLLLLKIRS